MRVLQHFDLALFDALATGALALRPATFTKLARFAVGAWFNPTGMPRQAIELAVEQAGRWLPEADRGHYERLVERVGGELQRFFEHERLNSEAVPVVLKTAEDLFARQGLDAAELVDRNLDAGQATAELWRRGRDGGLLTGLGELDAACRRFVQAVYAALFADREALDELRPAIIRALLAHRNDINDLSDNVARALRGMIGRGLLADPRRVWRPSLPPTALLRAEYGIVPFHEGREDLIADVLAWCEDDEPVKVRLFTGAGGIGKTRLMIELCGRLRGRHWRAGFLDKEAARAPDWALDALLGEGKHLFLVVDYAETRRDVLEPLLRRATLGRVAGRLRVVLVARALADWWRGLQTCDADVQELLDDSRVIVEEVRPLADSLDQRRRVFTRAAEALTGKIDHPSPLGPPPDLSAPHFEPVLFLHIAALAAVGGNTLGGEQELLDYVLDRERRAWEVGLAAVKLTDLDVEAIRQTAALVTLVGGAATRAEARSVVARVPLLEGPAAASRDRLAELLHRLYPGERYLEGVGPDLLGEHLVDRVFEDDPSVLDAAFVDRVSDTQLDSTLTVLTRLAQRRPEAGQWLEQVFARHLDRVAEIAVNVAVETGDPIGRVLAEAMQRAPVAGPDLVRAYRLLNLLPDQTIALRELRVVVAERCLDALKSASDPAEALRVETGRILNNLCGYRGELGRREEALSAAEEAVAIRRELAATRPDAFRPDLATSLNNLAVALGALGRSEAALVAAEEAVQIYRELAAARPDAFHADLAMALHNLAKTRFELGRHEAALESAEEAVVIRRELAATRPDAFRSELAVALTGLTALLGDLGRHEAALAIAEEAVAIGRELAATRPDAFRPGLAGSLSNLANQLRELGRREEALSAAEEAVAIGRKLAAARPDAFRPGLVRSLSVWAHCLEARDRLDEALAVNTEAIAALSPYFEALPPAFAELMSVIVQNYVRRCERAGREPSEELLRPIVEVFERLHGQQDGGGGI